MSIDLTIEDSVATVTINRPERMNAMDSEHYAALSDVWQRVRDDDGIRVAIVTGAGGKAFTVGADLKSRFSGGEPLSDLWLTQKGQLLNRGLEVWKPVISAIGGYCLGGGMTLMLATDIRVADETSTFSVAEVKRGLIPANGGTQRLISQLPHAIAMEMLLTGDAISVETAERWGLINKIVPAGTALDAAKEYAVRIAANAPLALQAAKELALRSRDLDLATGLRLEQVVARILRSSEDAKEGPRAFAEKRQPRFTGR
ncbi:enoyl-CoA hydratase-related protein [Mesorhizobium sp. CAU 1741]|uniref:enoyl-CoA hydratase/isomerase family protein n=1 Tax=Mesorhizobium sp. CAU 1741 TaxID=3140366 RepID=UPI00325AD557